MKLVQGATKDMCRWHIFEEQHRNTLKMGLPQGPGCFWAVTASLIVCVAVLRHTLCFLSRYQNHLWQMVNSILRQPLKWKKQKFLRFFHPFKEREYTLAGRKYSFVSPVAISTASSVIPIIKEENSIPLRN